MTAWQQLQVFRRSHTFQRSAGPASKRTSFFHNPRLHFIEVSFLPKQIPWGFEFVCHVGEPFIDPLGGP